MTLRLVEVVPGSVTVTVVVERLTAGVVLVEATRGSYASQPGASLHWRAGLWRTPPTDVRLSEFDGRLVGVECARTVSFAEGFVLASRPTFTRKSRGGRQGSGMEMREVEAFVAVAEELHFRKAAERLRLTPSRVSQAVRTLERRVGGPLFRRTSRRVRLTPVGEELFAAFSPALRRMETGLLEARRSSGSPGRDPLRVGFATSVAEGIQQRLMMAFFDRHDIPFFRYVAPVLDLYQWLDEDRDGVFVTWLPCTPEVLEHPRLRAGAPIRREPRGVLVAEDHPLAGRLEVDVEELADHRVVTHPRPDHTFGQFFQDAWSPQVTPGGRTVQRVQRGLGRAFEEFLGPIRSEGLAHITLAAIIETQAVTGVSMVPLRGLPPYCLAPVWSVARESSAVLAFAEFAVEFAVRSGWLDEG